MDVFDCEVDKRWCGCGENDEEAGIYTDSKSRPTYERCEKQILPYNSSNGYYGYSALVPIGDSSMDTSASLNRIFVNGEEAFQESMETSGIANGCDQNICEVYKHSSSWSRTEVAVPSHQRNDNLSILNGRKRSSMEEALECRKKQRIEEPVRNSETNIEGRHKPTLEERNLDLLESLLKYTHDVSYEITSQEVDELLDDILFDLKMSEKNSQQEGLENLFAGVGIDDIIQPNHSEPNFNSSENLCDFSGEYENVGQKTFCSSESFHNASGMVHASGEAVSPIKQHINDREVPNSVGEVIPSDARVSFSTHDISNPCEISATGRSTFLKNYSYVPERNSDQRMDNAAPHLSETLPGSDHSYCRKLNSLPTKLNSLPTSFAPFEFTRKRAGRKRKRRS